MSEFKNYFTKQFSNDSTCESEVKEIFNALEITDHRFKNIVTRYQIDDDRVSVVINTITKKGNIGRVLIDVINDEPTWFQLINVNFEIGQDCEIKIIVYNDSYCHKGDKTAALTWATIKRDYYAIGATVLRDSNDKFKATYEIDPDHYYFMKEDYDTSDIKDFDRELTKKDMQILEFEIHKDGAFQLWNPPIIRDPGHWGASHTVYHERYYNYSYYWEKEGYYNSAFIDSDSDSNFFKWLIENKYDVIKEKYKNHKIEILTESGKITGIAVLVWEKPYSDYLRSNSEEKEEIFEECFKNHTLPGLIEDILPEYLKLHESKKG